MALAAGTIFEANASATASNVNGGGFNPNNANMLTSGSITSATGNSPVFSDVNYSFVAGDVNQWLYIKSGTNVTPGWYPVISVAGGQATLGASIGAAVQVNGTTGFMGPNTVAGCATTASPSSVTWTMDYSQGTTSPFTATDLTGATNTCTSATNPIGPQWTGNLINLNSGTGVTAGVYEIVSVASATATLDRSAGTTYSAVTYHLGGAFSLGAAGDGTTTGLGAAGTAILQNRWFIKSGSFSAGASWTFVAGAAGNRNIVEGYKTIRGDKPSVASGNQPILNMNGNVFSPGANTATYNLTILGQGTNVCSVGGSANLHFHECRIYNNSTTVSRNGCNFAAGCALFGCDVQSYRGTAIATTAAGGFFMDGCYIHDSNIGYNISSGTFSYVTNCIFVGCISNCISNASASTLIYLDNNTFYGAENKLGLAYSASSNQTPVTAFNNIFYGFTTAISQAVAASGQAFLSDYNDYFNNTNDVTSAANISKGQHDIAVDPQFANVAQVTFTNGTTSGNVLTSSGANFSGVTDGQDYLYIVSGTGITSGYYGITSHTTTTLTLDIAPGTNATADKVGQVTTGRNWAPTGAI